MGRVAAWGLCQCQWESLGAAETNPLDAESGQNAWHPQLAADSARQQRCDGSTAVL